MSFREKVNYWVKKSIIRQNEEIKEDLLLQNGKVLCFTQPKKIKELQEAEFKVFSQWGEDGIIQFLINKIPIENKTFIEFGVEDYEESNTKFLLMNNNWSGMIIDGSEDAINHVKNTRWFWKYDIKAIAKFITKDNIRDILSESKFDEDLGILSVDIDGNDYWILRELDNWKPRILICEYNAVFGYDRAVTIPYEEDFQRTKAHYSNLYWGASLQAFIGIANERGYTLVGTNSAANNAFFVRNDLLEYIDFDYNNIDFPEQKYRESRDVDGRITLLSNIDEKRNAIGTMKLLDIETNETICVFDL